MIVEDSVEVVVPVVRIGLPEWFVLPLPCLMSVLVAGGVDELVIAVPVAVAVCVVVMSAVIASVDVLVVVLAKRVAVAGVVAEGRHMPVSDCAKPCVQLVHWRVLSGTVPQTTNGT